MQIKSLYVPESTIQNDEFPAHITWDQKENLEVTVTLPKAITVKEVYNVPENAIHKVDDLSTKFDQFEVNGYVGFVFKTQLMDEYKSIENIQFCIKDLKTSKAKTFTKQIQLFRPSVKVIEVPSVITIEVENENNLVLDNKIHLKNYGDGTALISVKVISEDGFEMSVPHEIEEFNSNVLQTLEVELSNLKLEYSEYSSVIDDFFSLFNQPISLDKTTKEKTRSVQSALHSIFEEHEAFSEDFLMCIWSSYIKNIQLITKIESFINYLNSIGNNKIILLNSIELLKCEKLSGNIKFLIHITDLNYNDYQSIETPFIFIKCENTVRVPIYSFFEWNNESHIGD